ncbi:hypothetical protein QCA50_019326 [Cerrena zonata]|uniref:Major facilitator superfamily (MFS) profile domain-containing protein n=1 Tax=Cerrena zonata TaxID=2478898 RepID=A0AAW0FLQ3_9APHY
MTHSPRTSLEAIQRSNTKSTPIPRILVADNEAATSSSVDLSKSLAIDSALEVDADGVLPPPPSSDRIRRRSELRQKPVFTGEEFELPVLPSLPEGLQTPPLQVHASGIAPGHDDIELASGFPSTTASSVHMEDTSSTAPVLSPAEKAQHRWKGRLHFFALCYCTILQGWNDGSTGPLLPTIQRYHNIGFAIVSLLFIFNCIGFVSGAMMNVYLNDRLGFGKVIVLGAACQLGAYVILSPGGPFPTMCIAFSLAGFGIALQNAQANGFVGNLKNAQAKFGFLHGSYGLGAFIAPLVATNFATKERWYFHYLISAAIGISTTAVLLYVFRLKNQDDIMVEAGHAVAEVDNTRENKYKQIFGLRTVHLLSIWALIYVGVEVTLGGWIVTFIEQKRGGGTSAGYISSGFFGGLMLGRIALIWLNRKVGERRIMFIYAFLAIQLEVTVWVVPSLIENAVAISCIGFLLGPMYPILMSYCTQILPRWLLTGCVGWIGSFGQTGSAALPFATGLLASKFGIGSLQPFVVSMMSTMILLWAFVPRVRRVD